MLNFRSDITYRCPDRCGSNLWRILILRLNDKNILKEVNGELDSILASIFEFNGFISICSCCRRSSESDSLLLISSWDGIGWDRHSWGWVEAGQEVLLVTSGADCAAMNQPSTACGELTERRIVLYGTTAQLPRFHGINGTVEQWHVLPLATSPEF